MSTQSAPDDIDNSSAGEDEHPAPTLDNQPSTSASHKKKKKKRSKAAKVIDALSGKSDVPQQLVDEVMAKAKEEHGESSEVANEENIRVALQHLKIQDVLKGRTGLGGINRKDTGEHKFWATQPVPQMGDEFPAHDGFIEPSRPREEVRQEPYPLPKDFVWSTLDIDDPNQIKELYDLLSLHYVEDDDASFRFQYSAEFLEWALKPPGYFKEWHVGVRVASSRKLVAFISGVPIRLRVRANQFDASEINYLCIHKRLRSKRLAPVLIKEVTRQVHLQGIFQAIYTVGTVLPTPVSTCRYYHRSLNIAKLIDVRFTYVPRNMTLARMIRQNRLPTSTSLPGLREMEDRDVPQVTVLFEKYMRSFDMVPLMTEDDIRHQLLNGRGVGGTKAGRREKQVTWTFIVENPSTHKVTDFFSFYALPSTIIGDFKYGTLEAAYLYYYATDVAFSPDASPDKNSENRLIDRVQDLVGDALVIADQAKFDVFNALTLMDNVPILNELKFGAGDGMLNFYLYNWRTPPLAGFASVGERKAGKGIGVVML